jgi:nucleoside-triphosphatase
MELKSKEFIDAAKNLFKSDKNVIVAVHQKLEHPLIQEFKEKSGSLISISLENRDKVTETLLSKLIVYDRTMD